MKVDAVVMEVRCWCGKVDTVLLESGQVDAVVWKLDASVEGRCSGTMEVWNRYRRCSGMESGTGRCSGIESGQVDAVV